MSRFSLRRSHDESGMSTAEYAVGTVGACGFAGILIKLTQTEWFGDLVQGFIESVTDYLPF